MLYFDILANKPAEATALIFRDVKTTYGELRAQINQWANFLQAKGLKQGEKVGLFSKNCSYYVAAYFAVIKAGGVVIPLNYQLAPREVAYIIKDSHMKFLITQVKLPLADVLTELNYPNIEQLTYEDMRQPVNHELINYRQKEEDNCTIIYTSGTTGKPKGAMLSHKNLVANTIDFMAVVKMYPTDINLCVLPMYHCFAWTVSVSGPLYTGSCVVVQSTYIFKDIMRVIKEQNINTFVGVPTMMQLFYEKATVEELKEIRYFISGGAPLPRTLAENFYRKFSIPVQEGYGLSEASPVVTVNPASKIKIGSIGPALPAVRIKIVDENSNPLPPTKVGELCVQGNNVMLGYLNLPEETAHTLRDGWLHTGDIVYSDEEGYLYLVDRLKDMIISSGENIYPREVEEVIYAYPGVEEAAVIGIPDKLRGEAVCAYLVPKAGVTLEKQALRKYLLDHVAPYKVPRKFYFCTELPKSGTGKILKKVLREQATVNAISR